MGRTRGWSLVGAVLLLGALGVPGVRAAPPAQIDPAIVLVVTSPRPGERLAGPIAVTGYALDRRSPAGSGLNEADIRLYLDSDQSESNLIGYAGGSRPSAEAAAAHGAQFAAVGFERLFDPCGVPAGSHVLIVWVSSLVAPGSRNVVRTDFEVAPCAGTRGDAPAPAAAGLVGRWNSNFGPVTLEHAAITGRDPVAVRGFWQQEPGNTDCPLEQPLPGCLGRIEPGTFDPVTRVLEFAYYQDWNDTHGLARFTLSSDGSVLNGTWTQPGETGDWTMQR
jgi:hypothetical protein